MLGDARGGAALVFQAWPPSWHQRQRFIARQFSSALWTAALHGSLAPAPSHTTDGSCLLAWLDEGYRSEYYSLKLRPLRKANQVAILAIDKACCFFLFPFVRDIYIFLTKGKKDSFSPSAFTMIHPRPSPITFFISLPSP